MDINIDIDVRRCVQSLWFFRRGYARLSKPDWISRDPLDRLMQDQKILLSDGIVVWAHIIQANGMLYEPGPHDCPGEIVYDPKGRKGPEELGAVAGRMFSLKGKTPDDPALREVGDYLANERIRAFGKVVPAAISRDGLRYSTVLFCRKHLPDEWLAQVYFPVIISEKCEGSAMVLPSRWWPRELLQRWRGEEGN